MMKRKKGILIVSIGCLLCLCGCGEEEELFFFQSGTTEATYVQEQAPEVYEAAEEILVYVCGAVCEPGVIVLSKDARVVDAIAKAGGMTQEADAEYMNLAAQLVDGEKLYVPTKAEVMLLEETRAKEAFVNINTADMEELCTLPGIGESKAADIIAYRKKQGEFTCKEDIMKVPGIKESVFIKIEDMIIVE